MQMSKPLLPIDYLCIEIANSYGKDSNGFKGDKDTFDNRINWVKQNINNLEALSETANEDVPQYIKAVMALRQVQEGKPTGASVTLDATCSGLQILSALTGCVKGARITNLLEDDVRYDAYTVITGTLNKFLLEDGLEDLTTSRAKAKDAVMTALYGSKATPREIFQLNEVIDAFYDACFTEAEGAFTMLDKMLKAWQPYQLNHHWTLPDGHIAHVNVIEKEEIRPRIELPAYDIDHRFTTSIKENIGTKTGVSLPANITHSVDAYLLRCIIRRCSYNPKTVKTALELMGEIAFNEDAMPNKTINNLISQFDKTNMIDAVWFQVINKDTAETVPDDIRERLVHLSNMMLSSKPFSVLTVHDAFRVHFNNANALRFHYKEIMAELAESTLLNSILTEITGKKTVIKKLSKGLGKRIRESIYPIC